MSTHEAKMGHSGKAQVTVPNCSFETWGSEEVDMTGAPCERCPHLHMNHVQTVPRKFCLSARHGNASKQVIPARHPINIEPLLTLVMQSLDVNQDIQFVLTIVNVDS